MRDTPFRYAAIFILQQGVFYRHFKNGQYAGLGDFGTIQYFV